MKETNNLSGGDSFRSTVSESETVAAEEIRQVESPPRSHQGLSVVFVPIAEREGTTARVDKSTVGNSAGAERNSDSPGGAQTCQDNLSGSCESGIFGAVNDQRGVHSGFLTDTPENNHAKVRSLPAQDHGGNVSESRKDANEQAWYDRQDYDVPGNGGTNDWMFNDENEYERDL